MDKAGLERLKSDFQKILSENLPLTEKIKNLHTLCDTAITENYKNFNLDKIDCSAGCGRCCILNVATLEPEIDLIADYVNLHFSEQNRLDLIENIKETYIATFGLDDEERVVIRKKCVFLDNSLNCSIYPARPILCRAVTSTDSKRCAESVAASTFGDGITILSNIHIKNIYTNLFNTLADYMKSSGRNSRSIPLTVRLKKSIDKINY